MDILEWTFPNRQHKIDIDKLIMDKGTEERYLPKGPPHDLDSATVPR